MERQARASDPVIGSRDGISLRPSVSPTTTRSVQALTIAIGRRKTRSASRPAVRSISTGSLQRQCFAFQQTRRRVLHDFRRARPIAHVRRAFPPVTPFVYAAARPQASLRLQDVKDWKRLEMRLPRRVESFVARQSKSYVEHVDNVSMWQAPKIARPGRAMNMRDSIVYNCARMAPATASIDAVHGA